jgi:hypothetical protein
MRAALVAILLLLACESLGRGPKATAPVPATPVTARAVTDITAEDFQMPPLPRARVTLVDAYGYTHAVDAEVAATRESRTRGLMWRRALAEGTGMLFIFPEEEWLTFWMKNTLIPLDMIFLSKDQVIVGIVERAEPKTLTSRGPEGKALYVLEVPGGWAGKIGLAPGLKVTLEGTQSIVPTQ